METQTLIDIFKEAGQGHVFRFWDELDESQKEHLLAQARQIDLPLLKKLIDQEEEALKADAYDWSSITPAPYIAHPSQGGTSQPWEEAAHLGEEALRAGRVAAFTVAGGQGTRLGYEGPKGAFPVTPIRRKPIFQVFAEKLRTAQERYGVDFHWFIMTGLENHEATIAFFKEHSFFGLEHVHFFRQGAFPAVDQSGKLILSQKHSIAMSPNGHGGALKALVESGATQTMKTLGVDIISFFQVDNPLINVIDPAFIGFHLSQNSEMSSKMVPKSSAEERVGVFCSEKDHLRIIEYSDFPESQAQEKDADGVLAFRCGNVAIHTINRDFVERLGGHDASASMPYHYAKKKVLCIDSEGNPLDPEHPNGTKFELFIFDALTFAKNPIVIETERAREFSPVKNAQGADSVQTCHDDQLRLFACWAQAAGVDVPVDESGLPPFSFEISPLFADNETTFVERFNSLDPKPEIKEGTYLE